MPRRALGLLIALAATAAAGASPTLELSPCRLAGVATELRCGSLARPLDPARPQGPQITLQVALLPALARHAQPDPVVFFAGGPGQSAIDLAPQVQALLGRLQTRRDVLLIDQRGTGRSAPLSCEERSPPARPLAEQFDSTRAQQRVAACRQRLQALPYGDLRFFSTAIASTDVEAVRQALGLGPVNLVGMSYGTRAALDYQRQFPASVRRVVLDGVAPPDMGLVQSMGEDSQAAFDALLAAAEPQRPGLGRQWQALLASMPRSVALRHPYSGREETLALSAENLASLVRMPLYQPALAAGLPAAIGLAAEGDFAPLVALASGLGGAGTRPLLAEGMHLSVVCSEDAPEQARPAGAVGAATLEFYRQACAGWPRAEVPPAFRQLAPARQATLLLSGGQDPATPPRHGERVAAALGPLAQHLGVAQAGHGVMGLACMRELAQRFIEAEDDRGALAIASRDGGCAKQVPRPPAFRPLMETLR